MLAVSHSLHSVHHGSISNPPFDQPSLSPRVHNFHPSVPAVDSALHSSNRLPASSVTSSKRLPAPLITSKGVSCSNSPSHSDRNSHVDDVDADELSIPLLDESSRLSSDELCSSEDSLDEIHLMILTVVMIDVTVILRIRVILMILFLFCPPVFLLMMIIKIILFLIFALILYILKESIYFINH